MPVEEPSALPEAGAPLGVGMVCLILVAGKAGSLLAKAALTVAVNKLEEEVKRRRAETHDHARVTVTVDAGRSGHGPEAVELQIQVELPNAPRRSFPPLGPASVTGDYTWEVAFEMIRKLIDLI